ncbi:membrane protein insertion efficiency factor YidD [Buchnera aphidicola]|uniref:membrane protein insertion efficiency factor YidD n=1 Tax=Buchnera aphidicola TaxID=9 RepID=UPI003464CF7C
MVKLLSIISNFLIFIIIIYQRCISVFLQPCCRFYPSCSQYALDILKKFSLIKSIYLILKRVLQCHPFCFYKNDIVFKKIKDKREYK